MKAQIAERTRGLQRQLLTEQGLELRSPHSLMEAEPFENRVNMGFASHYTPK